MAHQFGKDGQSLVIMYRAGKNNSIGSYEIVPTYLIMLIVR